MATNHGTARGVKAPTRPLPKIDCVGVLRYGSAPMRTGPHRTPRRARVSLTLLVLLAALPACQQGKKEAAAPAAEESGEVIATFGGHKLTSGQVMRELERLPPPSRTYLAVPERKRQFVDNMIMNDL